VLAGGSIESPKLLRRSSMYPWLPDSVKGLVGRGLTDHPTTDWIRTLATHMGNLNIRRDSHAKIVFYSRGNRDAQDRIRYPFNVEMNVNHEYWHLRENDPSFAQQDDTGGASRVEIKFSFGNCLDDHNEVKGAPPYGYVPEVAFRNLNWVHHLSQERFPALAGWQKDVGGVWNDLNAVADQIFAHFQNNGAPVQPVDGKLGQGKGFGSGTVHHAIGTLRMPWRPRYDGPVQNASVVDENLEVIGAKNLYVCDMSVMPFSSAANPVRTLVGLALRMSRHFG
jgi:GMC oxidoreductase